MPPLRRAHPALSPPRRSSLRQPQTSSPMILSDRLITLAQDADRAGFAVTAEHLVHLAHTVFEEPHRLA